MEAEGKKLSHVGCLLCAGHHAEHPCALDLSTLIKEESSSSGMRMGGLKKMSDPPEKAPPPGPEPKFKARSAGRF